MTKKHNPNKIHNDDNRFFHSKNHKSCGATQTTTVTVTIKPAPEKEPGCFESILKCVGKGAKSGAAA